MMIDRNDDKHFAHRSLKVGLASAPCLEASCSQRATHSSNYSTKAVDQVQPVFGVPPHITGHQHVSALDQLMKELKAGIDVLHLM